MSNWHNALSGGQDNVSVYAVLVSRSGLVTPIANLPEGTTYSVAINNAGGGIMGGTSQSQPYAAFVSPQGLPTGDGFLDGIALDRSGYCSRGRGI